MSTDSDSVQAEPFWNATNGCRPAEAVPGLFESICHKTTHIYDVFYGPNECARCGSLRVPNRLADRGSLLARIRKARIGRMFL